MSNKKCEKQMLFLYRITTISLASVYFTDQQLVTYLTEKKYMSRWYIIFHRFLNIAVVNIVTIYI